MLDKTILLSFAGTDIHKKYQEHLVQNYRDKFGLIVSWDLDSLSETDFYKENQHIFKYKKYSGYFLWKPYLIKRTLLEYQNYNVLYVDSNLYFKDIEKFEKIFKYYMDETGFFFVKHWNRVNRGWTKRDCFILMGADESKYWNANQVWSVIQGWSHSRPYYKLLNDYITFCSNELCITEQSNIYGENLPEFKEHRWEQSILSILIEYYKIKCTDDREIIQYVDKDYNQELLKQKDEENKNPLGKV